MKLITALLLLTLPLCSDRGHTSDEGDLTLLATWMTGSFSSAEQAAADTNYFDIRLRMARMWEGRDDGVWLYVEQASAVRLERPYRQRVYRLTASGETLRSEVFLLPDPLRFAGAWRNVAVLDGLTPDSLIAREGCSILLKRTGPRSFAGSTAGNGCPSELRGARYATSAVTISDTGMMSWDRGFDADGKQVWGAETGGYMFRKIREH